MQAETLEDTTGIVFQPHVQLRADMDPTDLPIIFALPQHLILPEFDGGTNDSSSLYRIF